MGNLGDNSTLKSIVVFLLAMLTFVAGWATSAYEERAQIQQVVDIEIQRVMGPQLATMSQKLDDIQAELAQIAEFQLKH